MALSNLTPPRSSPPKTAPSKMKIRAMCNAIDQYFEYTHNQCPEKLARFRVIDSMEPKPKGRLGGWKTYERLQLASEAMMFFGENREKSEGDFWAREITIKFSDGDDDEEEVEEEGEEVEENGVGSVEDRVGREVRAEGNKSTN